MALLANDKYRATLRTVFIDGTDTVLNVTAIPTNLPTQVTVNWNTAFEAVFKVTGTSGTTSANYALTGITKVKGYTGNQAEGSSVNCLNQEEFFNQYEGVVTGDILEGVSVSSAVNKLTVTNAATGNAPSIAATGGDTNIDINITGKGTGGLSLTSPKVVTGINDTNGNELLKVTATGSAVNELTLANAATGGVPTLEATGGDTNIHASIKGKGNGLVKISVLRQDITTNAYKHNTVILSGWNHMLQSSGSSNVSSKTVTFGITFAAAPIVIPGLIGIKYTTAPAAIGDLTTQYVGDGLLMGWGVDSITTTTFRISGKMSANAGADTYRGVGWIAIGEL